MGDGSSGAPKARTLQNNHNNNKKKLKIERKETDSLEMMLGINEELMQVKMVPELLDQLLECLHTFDHVTIIHALIIVAATPASI